MAKAAQKRKNRNQTQRRQREDITSRRNLYEASASGPGIQRQNRTRYTLPVLVRDESIKPHLGVCIQWSPYLNVYTHGRYEIPGTNENKRTAVTWKQPISASRSAWYKCGVIGAKGEEPANIRCYTIGQKLQRKSYIWTTQGPNVSSNRLSYWKHGGQLAKHLDGISGGHAINPNQLLQTANPRHVVKLSL